MVKRSDSRLCWRLSKKLKVLQHRTSLQRYVSTVFNSGSGYQCSWMVSIQQCSLAGCSARWYIISLVLFISQNFSIPTFFQKPWSGGSTYTEYVTVTFEKNFTSTIYELTMSRRRQGWDVETDKDSGISSKSICGIQGVVTLELWVVTSETMVTIRKGYSRSGYIIGMASRLRLSKGKSYHLLMYTGLA